MGDARSCSTGYFSDSVGPSLPFGGAEEEGGAAAAYWESIEGGRPSDAFEPPWPPGDHAPGGAQTEGRKRSIGVHTTETRGVIDMRLPAVDMRGVAPGSWLIRGEYERGVTPWPEPIELPSLACDSIRERLACDMRSRGEPGRWASEMDSEVTRVCIGWNASWR